MATMSTRLTSVTVYPDRARVTRQGQVTLEAGLHQLEIADLPLRMDASSARAAARGTARARLLGLDIKRRAYAETPVEQVRQLEAQVEAAQDEQQALQARLALVSGARTRLDAIASHTELYATALAGGEQTPQAQLSMFDELRQQAAKLDDERLSLQQQQRSLERRLQALQRQLDQLRSQRPRERFSAWVEVEVSQPGELSVELTYVVSGAGWTPLYDLRLAENGASPASLEVGYLAQVTQQSGEDWPDVALALSTARPALAGTLPELEPVYLFPAPPPPPPGRAMYKASMAADSMPVPAPMAMAAPQAVGAGAPVMVEEAVAALAEVDSSGAAVTYHVPAQVSIPSDGGPHKVTVASYRLKPRLDYASAPLLVEAAYRRARVANDSPYTLLPGQANLFAGDEFIGATNLELTAPAGELELYLGVDDRVKVERKLVRREVDKTMLGGKRRVHYGYAIQVESLLETPTTLAVHDRIPVGRHEEIKVRLDSSEPRPTKHSELNLLDWELDLAPRQKLTLRFDYTVEFPQAMEIRNLA